MQWLFECLSTWQHVPEDAYRYKLPKLADAAAASDSVMAVDTTDDSKPEVSTRTTRRTASTPNAKAASSGRFDVDDILTELNETTPVNKASDAGAVEASSDSAGTTGGSKDVACKLFDTPSAESKTQSKTDSSSSSSKKRDAAESASDKPEPRTSKRRAASSIAKSAAKEPDNEDDVKSDDDVDMDAAPVKAKAAPKTTKTAKKASASLAQASSEALEALGANAAAATKVRGSCIDTALAAVYRD